MGIGGYLSHYCISFYCITYFLFLLIMRYQVALLQL